MSPSRSLSSLKWLTPQFSLAIDAHPPDHPRHGSRGSFVAVKPDWRAAREEEKAKLDRINAAAAEDNKAAEAQQ